MEQHQNTFNSWLTLRPYLLLLAVLAALLCLQYQVDLHDLLKYQRSTFLSQPEQSITHAFVHLNTQHFLLNTAALVCLFILFNHAFQSFSWILVLLFSAASSAAGLYLYSPSTEWCVGLSGALHGLAIFAMLRSRVNPLWLMLIALKLFIEQLGWFNNAGIISATEQLIRYPVIVDAHLWGATGGVVYYVATRAILGIRILIEINEND